jgi:hypothetical protein
MNRNLVYELTEQKICPGSYSFTWDGTVNTGYYEYPPDEWSNIAPAGLYTFDVEVIANPYDRDAVRSQALTVVPGPVEYLGYDDGGTPDDESDDNHLYYLRWYALYSGRDASYGEIWLYDPDLERVQIWIVPVLQCVVHENCDGLTANPNGEIHGVIIPVPVSLITSKAVIYRFVLHFYDDYADSYKNHQIKSTLEVNQFAYFLPILYIEGVYQGTKWQGVWCQYSVDRATRFVNPPDSVRNRINGITQVGSSTVAAGVNGTFFDPSTFALVGHVGTGAQWIGNDITRHRWAYGDKGYKPDWIIERMQQVTGTNTYTIPSGVRKYPFGLTGIGCLINGGTPTPFNQQDWHVSRDWRDAWTIVAWGESEYLYGNKKFKNKENFFLIICQRGGTRGDTGYSQGWTWDDAVNFLIKELPSFIKRNATNVTSLTIIGAMMLDGGSSTQFVFRCAPMVGRVWEMLYGNRNVPTMVEVKYQNLINCPVHLHP